MPQTVGLTSSNSPPDLETRLLIKLPAKNPAPPAALMALAVFSSTPKRPVIIFSARKAVKPHAAPCANAPRNSPWAPAHVPSNILS